MFWRCHDQLEIRTASAAKKNPSAIVIIQSGFTVADLPILFVPSIASVSSFAAALLADVTGTRVEVDAADCVGDAAARREEAEAVFMMSLGNRMSHVLGR